MKKFSYMIGLLLLMGLFAACSDNNENLEDELPELNVDFDVPENADAGDNVHLEAVVTYDDQPVEKADEVLFEIWEKGDQDNGEKIEAENEGEGIYTLDYDFDDDGIYEMYAHTTAEGLHTMPKEQIIIGDVEESDYEDEESEDNDSEFHTEGFDIDFNEPEDVTKDQATTLTTNVTLDDEALKDLDVRYEISNDDNTDWVDTEEDTSGEYSAEHTFSEAGSYAVTIHMEDDDDLHEHATYDITVE